MSLKRFRLNNLDFARWKMRLGKEGAILEKKEAVREIERWGDIYDPRKKISQVLGPKAR